MGNLLGSISDLVAQYPAWTHTIIGVGTLLQGEAAILFSVLLVINKVISWREYFLWTAGTMAMAEISLFLIAKLFRKTRFGWKLYRKYKGNRRLQFYTYYLKQNLAKLLVVAKFVPGTNFVILALTGWSRTTVGKFLKAYGLSITTWFAVMTAVAYGAMSGVTYLKSVIDHAEYVGIGIVVVFIAAQHILKRFFNKQALAFGGSADLEEEEDTK